MFCLLLTSLLLDFRFHPEDRGSMCLRNIGVSPQMYTVSQPLGPPQWSRTNMLLSETSFRFHKTACTFRCGASTCLVVRKARHSCSFRLVCLHYYLMKLSPLAWQGLFALFHSSLPQKQAGSRSTKHISNLQEFTQAGQKEIWGQVPSFSNVIHSEKRAFIRS